MTLDGQRRFRSIPSINLTTPEAAVVRQMYRWLVEEQLSSYTIQKRLIERDVPTRKGGGRCWSQSTIIRILSSTTYKGDQVQCGTDLAAAGADGLGKDSNGSRQISLKSCKWRGGPSGDCRAGRTLIERPLSASQPATA